MHIWVLSMSDISGVSQKSELTDGLTNYNSFNWKYQTLTFCAHANLRNPSHQQTGFLGSVKFFLLSMSWIPTTFSSVWIYFIWLIPLPILLSTKQYPLRIFLHLRNNPKIRAEQIWQASFIDVFTKTLQKSENTSGHGLASCVYPWHRPV